jgi:large subunit ribosomal protein L4e
MAARPLVFVQGADGKKSDKSVVLPTVFTAPIRPDVVQDVFTRMSKNKRQPYAVSKYAGMQHSAQSWGTGRAVARIPRVQGSGTHRAGQGAFGNMCRGGRMFGPTKTWRKWHAKISVNQRRYATCSALAASAVPALLMARGHKIDNVPEVPLVIDTAAIQSLEKTREAKALLEKVGAWDDVQKAADSKQIRTGKGKSRGRRYTSRKGPLLVHNEAGPLQQSFRNLPGVEICNVSRLNLLQLAPGGHLGRFIIWTQDAFEALEGLYGSNRPNSSSKSGFQLPRSSMTNSDLTRIINSDEVQSVLREKITQQQKPSRKRNPLKNLGFMIKLNPYAKAERRSVVRAQQRSAASRDAAIAAKRDAKDTGFNKKKQAIAKRNAVSRANIVKD